MFRRRWSGLPEDPVFPADLKKLGYFVEPKSDEIRQIDDPKYYFHYFESKNTRYNDRKRFAFDSAVQAQLIHPRLEALGLSKLALPLGAGADDDAANNTDRRHVPIFVSPDLKSKKRVVVIFGETEQELGVIAHRVIGGPGGVDKGSMVGITRALLQQGKEQGTTQDQDQDKDSKDMKDKEDQDHQDSDTGVVLANTGELWWWPEGGRGLTPRGGQNAPMRSAVHLGRFRGGGGGGEGEEADDVVPQNEDAAAHVACVFEQVLGSARFVSPGAVVQVVGVGNGASAAEWFLEHNWARWGGGKIGCLATLGGALDADSVWDPGFREFLREKSRLYITSHEPAGTPISGPDGNDKTAITTSYGTHIFSSGERYYSELMLIKAQDVLLAWLAEVHRAGAGYANPEVGVTFADEKFEEPRPWSDDGSGPAREEGGEAEAGAAGAGAGFQLPTRQEEKDSGLEIITREEWDDRMRKEGKGK
ncbi:hypothetical protein Daus18300_010854 [Diaporthe australafricana]|uniref:Arb2 domain-containing protein n=1 Tax=Diaporthe australafricana TaxID=127596 RepID=A0ABR3W8X6_9PEZI